MAEYIEREAVMQKFADHVKRSNNSDFAPTPTWNQAVQIVEGAPAADVVPVRHGRWIKYAPCNSDLMTCSECEKYWILDGDQYDYRYCPNCGARMDKDGDGE